MSESSTSVIPRDTRPPPAGLSRDPDRAYHAKFEQVGPDTLAGRYLRRFWHPVHLLDTLAPGTARPLRVFGEDFTLYRGRDGRPQVVQDRCPHRGTRLSTGCVEGDVLRCFYHGWAFDPAGRCVDQPAEDERFAAKVAIRSYPTRAYLGMVFAYLGDGAPPEFPRLEIFEQAAHLDVAAVPRRCSYFGQLENSVDEVHINFVHRISGFADAGFTREVPQMASRETEYGIERTSTRGRERRIGHLLMPTVLMTTVPDPDNGWTQHVSWRVPVDDNSNISFMADAIMLEGAALDRFRARRAAEAATLAGMPPADVVATAILAGTARLEDAIGRPDLLTIQDSVALGGQSGVDRARDLCGRSDRSVLMLRRLWGRELRLLDEGLPLKQWRWPPDLRVIHCTVEGAEA